MRTQYEYVNGDRRIHVAANHRGVVEVHIDALDEVLRELGFVIV